jgi:RpiB/LacA/LacB family sugar-phosphate isomerase
MLPDLAIRRRGSHQGKHLVFAHHAETAGDAARYEALFSRYGIAVPAHGVERGDAVVAAQRVGERVRGRADRVGVLVCATGLASSIAANKLRGIYAARCLTPEDARLARQLCNANVLCLSLRAGVDANAEILDTFMRVPYEGADIDQLEYVTCLELESDPAPTPVAQGRAVGRTL